MQCSQRWNATLKKGRSLGNVKCHEFSGWGNRWVKKSIYFSCCTENKHIPVGWCFSYITFFKEIQSGFRAGGLWARDEGQNPGLKERQGSRGNVDRLAGAKRSGNRGCGSQPEGAHSNLNTLNRFSAAQLLSPWDPFTSLSALLIKDTFFTSFREWVPFLCVLIQHITSNDHLKSTFESKFGLVLNCRATQW